MNAFRSREGPYPIRLVYSSQEIDSICEEALRAVGLLPTEPGPIKVDRFLEKYFRVPVLYEEIGEGVIGCTVFDRSGAVTGFIISPSVEADGTQSGERRARSTLAHEGGHGLLHPRLFISDVTTGSLIKSEVEQRPRILCRQNDVAAAKAKPYDGRWWEWQANRAIAGLLMPKRLVTKTVAPFLDTTKLMPDLPESQRESVARELAAIFDVNPAVARIRIEEMYPRTTQIML